MSNICIKADIPVKIGSLTLNVEVLIGMNASKVVLRKHSLDSQVLLDAVSDSTANIKNNDDAIAL